MTGEFMNGLFDRKHFQSIMAIVNSELGNAQGTVMLTMDDSALTRFSNNIIHQNVAQTSYHLSVTVVKDKKVGKADTNILSEESIISTVRNALKIAKFTPEDESYLDLLESQKYTTLNRYCKETASMTPDDRAKIVAAAVELCKKHDFKGAGIVENASSVFMLGNSKGLYASHSESSIDYNISVYAEDGTSGWARGCSTQSTSCWAVCPGG
jgi:predicted Zn-dependent protease